MGASIKGFWNKIKGSATRASESRELLPALLIVVVGLASFGLGRLSVHQMITEETSVQLEQNAQLLSPAIATSTTSSLPSGEGYVASKSGTKYHLPWCSGAQRIIESNKVWFATKVEAEAAGYSPASNCKGI